MAHSDSAGKKVAFVPKSVASDHGDSDEDLARADTYGLLAEWFMQAPTDDLFNRLAASPAIDQADHSDLANAWRALIDAVSRANPHEAADEFDALFVAVGKPLVALHASVYTGGSMNQAILVELRTDLARLGLETSLDKVQSEDHFAALCEIMRYLIAAPDATGNMLGEQQRFFAAYFQPGRRHCVKPCKLSPGPRSTARLPVLPVPFWRLSNKLLISSVPAWTLRNSHDCRPCNRPDSGGRQRQSHGRPR
ncbi:molecular chaperone TorD family protein [Comamonadaceae bacterium M7527]|nr:molecular chaperone TorD family protein [Comamonadaceae bacterium M7527]